MEQRRSPEDVHALLSSLKAAHERIRVTLLQVQALARRVAEDRDERGWADLRRAFVELAITLAEHIAREESELGRVLADEGKWGELRAQLLRQEHAEQRARIVAIAVDVAGCDRPDGAVADDVRWLVGRLLSDMDDEEVSLFGAELLRADGRASASSVVEPTTCGDLMQRPVRWVSEEDTARTAARTMREANVGFLVVCDRSGRFRGTITDRDLALHALDDAGGAGIPVGTFMSTDVVACRPSDDISVAERLMAEHAKSRIVVGDEEGRVHGVISISDLSQRREASVASVLRSILRREARTTTEAQS